MEERSVATMGKYEKMGVLGHTSHIGGARLWPHLSQGVRLL